jgi:hypothetical protein
MAILEAPGETWNIKTRDGLYYTLFVVVASDFTRTHQDVMERSTAFRPSESDDTLKIGYHDIILIASGVVITSDTELGIQYGDSDISITRKNKSDIFEIAQKICPSKVPLRTFQPNEPGPYY